MELSLEGISYKKVQIPNAWYRDYCGTPLAPQYEPDDDDYDWRPYNETVSEADMDRDLWSFIQEDCYEYADDADLYSCESPVIGLSFLFRKEEGGLISTEYDLKNNEVVVDEEERTKIGRCGSWDSEHKRTIRSFVKESKNLIEKYLTQKEK